MARRLPVAEILRESFVIPWRRREVFLKALALAVTGGGIVAQLSEPLFESISYPVGLVIGTCLFARVALVLPATAIDAHTTPFMAWRQTSGNGWRMVVVIAILPWSFRYVYYFLAGEEPGVVRVILLTALTTVLLAVEITALSLSYRELSRETGLEATA